MLSKILVPVNVAAEIVSVTVTVTQTTANVSGLLRDTFIGTTALTVNCTLMSSGEMFSETSSVGGAGETLSVILTNLQVGVPYTYSVFVTHGSLMVEVTGTFISGMYVGQVKCNPATCTVLYIILVS